ncbi:nuclear lim interactor-interacting factor-related [Anaeramoeba flamelloides]|uniref:Nuclear lim interactor-interacting factor-related n=1 Tax=Anaeramoeba flamelloides TaxID=1746091 RepID=A0ABQ8XE33_9EUKA|nr:nuclear lim interactor-interacting factor-related [Anaeramoeba flamelloides]
MTTSCCFHSNTHNPRKRNFTNSKLPKHKIQTKQRRFNFNKKKIIKQSTQIVQKPTNQQTLTQKNTVFTEVFFQRFEKIRNNPFRKRLRILPKQKTSDEGKMTLCLDLDQTLIYGSFTPFRQMDFQSHVIGDPNKTIYVKKRPHLDDFLRKCSKLFEVVIYTASDPRYADAIINKLDPDNELISHRLYRQCCWPLSSVCYLKDLSILNRDITKVILVDDSPISFFLNPENGVEASPFIDDPLKLIQNKDSELLRILKIVQTIEKSKNVFESFYGPKPSNF